MPNRPTTRKTPAPASRASPKRDTFLVACPKCGHQQPEPRGAYSTICKQCQQHFRIEEALKPAVKPQKQALDQKTIRCFQCEAELQDRKSTRLNSSHIPL